MLQGSVYFYCGPNKPVMSMALSEARFSMLSRSPACPPTPNAAINSMSDRRPALCDLHQNKSKFCISKNKLG